MIRTSTRLFVNHLEDRMTPAGFDHVFHATDGPTLMIAVQRADALGGTTEIILDRAGLYNVPAALPISADITITGRTLYLPNSYVIQPAAGVQDRVIDITGPHTVTLQNLTIQNGTTSGDGGGIEVSGVGATLRLVYANVRDNTAGGNGGGIDMADGTLLSLYHANFSDNTAGANGGGVYFAADSQAGTVAVAGSTFTDNTAGGSTVGDGGGMDVVGLSTVGGTPIAITFTLQRTTFDGNTSSHNGGGVWAQDVSSLMADYVTLRTNTSGQDAGGLGDSAMNLDGATFKFTHGNASGNRVTGPGSGTTPDGGGVCFDFQGNGSGNVTVTVTNSRFASNTVAGTGAGLFVRDVAAGTTFNATVSADVFSANRTKYSPVTSTENGDGAGAYIQASGGSNIVTANSNTFTRNFAAQNGGGLALRLDSGTATVSGNTINYNTANGNGGGIYFTGTPGGTVLMQGNSIQYNTAGTAGGGVYNAGIAITSRRNTVANNTAPADPNMAGDFSK